jgi:hypothetical protein
MFSSLLLLSLAAVAPLAYATVAVRISVLSTILAHFSPKINQPIASTVWAAGQQQTITWIDSGAAPTLEQFGAATFELSVGTESTQVCSVPCGLIVLTNRL